MTLMPSAAPTAADLKILEGFSTVLPWIDSVCRAADANTNELGFLARSVFDQFARRDCLYVLIAEDANGQKYAGHLLFDIHFPRAHVRQMFVVSDFRKAGAASLLLDHLIASLTNAGLASIYARVAEDLITANAFWHKKRFYIQRSEKGGATKNRQILVRCRELDSPQLFPTTGINEHNPLGLLVPPANELPMYLLDMNVLFDVQPRRLRRNEASGMFQAERMNFCRLAISNELHEELHRTAFKERNTDPMMAYIEMFPCFPVDHTAGSEELFEELTKIVFPHTQVDQLSENSRSDIRHIMTAIHNELAGLVTNDDALLNAAPALEAKFKIQVRSSASFQLDEMAQRSQADAFTTTDNETLRITQATDDRNGTIRSFLLKKASLSGSEIANSWLSPGNDGRVSVQYAVWNDASCVGYITWPTWKTDDLVVARSAVDESDPRALEIARILLMHLIENVRRLGVHRVQLKIPMQQSCLREVSAGLGFVGSPGENLLKSVLGAVLTPDTWNKERKALASTGGPRLPEIIPDYTGLEQQMQIHTPDGNRVHIKVDWLESLLSPALFCLPRRPAVITPVRRIYAEPLLGHSPQGSLLPLDASSLFSNRKYISQAATLKHFKKGTLIFFYESSKDGGSSQIVAIARVREAYLKSCDALEDNDLHQSILTATTLTKIGKSSMKTVTVFDNIFALPHPVDLSLLKKIGCGRPNDLITTRPITEEQFQSILREGFGRD